MCDVDFARTKLACNYLRINIYEKFSTTMLQISLRDLMQFSGHNILHLHTLLERYVIRHNLLGVQVMESSKGFRQLKVDVFSLEKYRTFTFSKNRTEIASSFNKLGYFPTLANNDHIFSNIYQRIIHQKYNNQKSRKYNPQLEMKKPEKNKELLNYTHQNVL